MRHDIHYLGRLEGTRNLWVHILLGWVGTGGLLKFAVSTTKGFHQDRTCTLTRETGLYKYCIPIMSCQRRLRTSLGQNLDISVSEMMDM